MYSLFCGFYMFSTLFYVQGPLSFVFNIAEDCRYPLWDKILQHVIKKRCPLSSHSQWQSDFICHELWFIKEVANNWWQIDYRFFCYSCLIKASSGNVT